MRVAFTRLAHIQSALISIWLVCMWIWRAFWGLFRASGLSQKKIKKNQCLLFFEDRLTEILKTSHDESLAEFYIFTPILFTLTKI